MMHYKKRLGFIALSSLLGIVSICSSANLTTNLNWCTTNSGTINVSYGECRSLAFLYAETSGDNWNAKDNWFSSTDLSVWKGGDGSIIVNALTITGGHVSGINLSLNNLQNSIFSGLVGLPYLRTFAAVGTTLGQLTGINTSGLSLLSSLDISYNYNIAFDLSHSTGVRYLNLDNAYLDSTSINTNIAYLPNLTTLIISRIDYLTGIDLSHNPLLTYLDASLGTMSSIDLSSNPLLTTLLLNNNLFTGVDLSHNTGLTTLNLNVNQLSNLDISHNTALLSLAVNENDFSSLDISANSALQELYASENNLTYFDGGDLTNLSIISLGNNALTGINISQNTGILLLYINDQTGNGIQTLDISNQLLLQEIIGDNAGIQSLVTAPVGNYTQLIGTVSFAGNHLGSLSDGVAVSFLNNFALGWEVSQLTLQHHAPTFGGGGGSVTHGTVLSTPTPIKITPSVITGSTTTKIYTPRSAYSSPYQRAYTHGLTTLPVEKARLNDKILRYEAAKMIVNYVKHIEGKTIAHRTACDISLYTDHSTFDTEMNSYIQSICDLGIMGRSSPISKGLTSVFRPFDTLGIDEFNIIIGRYLGEKPHARVTSNHRVDIMKFLMNQAMTGSINK